MAITIQGLLPGSSGSIDERFQRTYQRTYRVHSTDLTTEDEFSVLAYMSDNGFSIYTQHPTDVRARVLGITATVAARFTDGPTRGLQWDVRIDWGSFSPLALELAGNPLDKPVTYHLDPVTVEQPVWKDLDGNPVVNAASDEFDPPVLQEVTQYILTVNRNEGAIDVVALLTLSGKGQINDAAWNDFPEKTVKILPIKIPERLYDQNADQLYYAMEYQFHVNFDTWTQKILNQGFGELVTSGGVTKRRAILDSSGQPATTPVMLDVDGHRLAQPIDHTNIVFLEFETQEAIDFSVFSLDGLFS